MNTDNLILETDIDRVVVLLDGARVFRSGRIDLKKGFQQIRASGLSRMLLKDSVRVSGKGTLGAIDVETQYQEESANEALKNFIQEEEALQKQIEQIREQLDFADRRKKQLTVLSDRFASEFPVWLASGSTNLSTLSDFIDFEEKQNSGNISLRRKLQDEIESLNKKHEIMRAEIDDFQNRTNIEHTVDVVIGIDADEAGPFAIDISYHVSGVSWQPNYDIDLGSEKAFITGMAQIRNTTLEDWNNVDLDISTAVFKPVRVIDPEPYIIDVYRPHEYETQSVPSPSMRMKAKKMKDVQVAMAIDEDAFEEMATESEPPEMIQPEAVVKENPSGVMSFDIPGKWSIPSDGNNHPVTLASYELPTRKQFYWAASDSTAIIAQDRITNGDAVLLAGKVKVYSEGEFIGETSIKQIAPGEEFDIGAREELKMKAEKKMLGRVKEKTGLIKGKRSLEYEYRLCIKNFRKESSEITVKDTIPFSHSEQIKVKWLKCSVTPDKDKLGVYTWKSNIKANDELTIIYSYSVEWEKDITVNPSLP